MRLQIFSDVHLDVEDVFVPRLSPGVDVVVVPGDLCEGIDRGMRWLRHHLGDEVAIVMVAGNHEYFAKLRPEERLAGLAAGREHRIVFLDDSAVVIDGVRFVGSTLWADYGLFGADRREEMMQFAGWRMMDHRRILEEPGRFITPAESLSLHEEARKFVDQALAEAFDGPTVVVTHHGPHPRSLADRYRDDLLSAAFISDLSPVIDRHQPDLWVHGHTHVGFDYSVGRTRVICNPHGYGDENPIFDPELVVEI
jgi:Icc-related predicted phosphoesterase